eukprot:gene418-530_t
MPPRIDYSLAPMFTIMCTAFALTGYVGYKRLSEDQDISLTRKGQMLWANKNNDKFIERKTAIKFYDSIHNGDYLKK